MSESVELRWQESDLDEIVAHGCSVHVERMTDSSYYLGIEAEDGTCWQFFISAKNGRSHVKIVHSDTSPPVGAE